MTILRKLPTAALVAVTLAGGTGAAAFAADTQLLACSRLVKAPDSKVNVWVQGGSNGCSTVTQAELVQDLSFLPDRVLATLSSRGPRTSLVPYSACTGLHNEYVYGRVTAGGASTDGRHEQEC